MTTVEVYQAEIKDNTKLWPKPWVHRLARRILLLLLLVVIGLLVLPWQQYVRGTGRVIAYAPRERQQTVMSLINGRVVKWYDNIRENVFVEKGQSLVQIEDVAPEYESLLVRALEAGQEKVRQAEEKIKTYDEQIIAYQDVLTRTIEIADREVEIAELFLAEAEQGLAEAVATLAYEDADLKRRKVLEEKDITSARDLQGNEQKFAAAQAKVKGAEAKVASAKSKIIAAKSKREEERRKADAQIHESEAKSRTAKGELALAQKELAKEQADLNRYISGKVVTAPTSGYIFKLLVNPGSDFVKAGDPLAIIIPDTQDRAVELFIDGNDIPLLRPNVRVDDKVESLGDPVRLQFEGFPAVQFTPGWPEIAVGTFAGRVELIDSSDSGMGQFRIVVRPDESEPDWPDERFTRQGVRVNGWILLNRVPLGYELWRRMNGFPPILNSDPSKEGNTKDKGKTTKPPLPK